MRVGALYEQGGKRWSKEGKKRGKRKWLWLFRSPGLPSPSERLTRPSEIFKSEPFRIPAVVTAAFFRRISLFGPGLTDDIILQFGLSSSSAKNDFSRLSTDQRGRIEEWRTLAAGLILERCWFDFEKLLGIRMKLVEEIISRIRRYLMKVWGIYGAKIVS